MSTGKLEPKPELVEAHNMQATREQVLAMARPV